MTSKELKELISRPELLNKDTLYELRNLLARYPYFQTARLLYLKNLYLLHDITFGEELRKAALYIIDRRVLFHLIEGENYVLTPAQKQIAEELVSEKLDFDRTLMLIDSFLSSIPDQSGNSIDMDIPMDYASYLLTSEDVNAEKAEIPKMKGQELIDGFIEKAEIEKSIKLKPITEDEEEEFESPKFLWEENSDDESYFTETLARIYVKQKRYSKALEIIKKLSLKYPKKNAYFADQISFLEKLIINTKSK